MTTAVSCYHDTEASFFFFFFVLRRRSGRCWVRLTPSYGPPFVVVVSVVDVPGVNFQRVAQLSNNGVG